MSSRDEEPNARVIALEAAIGTYGKPILGYLTLLTRNYQTAQDISQEFWLYVFVNFPIENFQKKGILKRKAFQLFVDHLRSRAASRGRQITYGEDMDKFAGQVLFIPATPAEDEVFREKFWSEFPTLEATDLQKDCYWLKERHGYTLENISTHLNISLSTAQRWIKEISKKMDAIWEEDSK